MNTLCCTPDYFTLFLYVRPDNKVKPISIMIVRIEMIFFTVLYHHPFVAKKGGDFDRLVVTEFYALQSVSFFQTLQIVVITADITIGKNGIQRSTVHTLRNLLVWIERFFGWSADNRCLEQVGFYQLGQSIFVDAESEGLKFPVTDMDLSLIHISIVEKRKFVKNSFSKKILMDLLEQEIFLLLDMRLLDQKGISETERYY